MALNNMKYVHGDLVLAQRNAGCLMSEHEVLNSNTTNCSIRDTVGSYGTHSFSALDKLSEKLKVKIENINKHWMYSWILSIQDLESWYHKIRTESAKVESDRGLASIFTFKGGKSHTLKKIREKAHELQTKMVGLC
jgi:hypothetical protein